MKSPRKIAVPTFLFILIAVTAVSLLLFVGCGGGGGGGATEEATTGDGAGDGAGGGDDVAGAGGNPSSIALVEPIAAGEEGCAAGGQRIHYGIDDNGNGELDTDEEDGSVVICNGESGADATGTGGTGPQGPPGPAGWNSLVDILPEPPSSNCPSGGERIDVGLDNGDGGGTPGDGILQAGEIDATEYVCTPGIVPNEGAPEAPVLLTVNVPHEGSVDTFGSSFYRFTASYDSEAVISLKGAEADLSWTLMDAGGAVVHTCDNVVGGVGDESCAAPVALGATYDLVVEEHGLGASHYELVASNALLVGADPTGIIYRIDQMTGATAQLSDTGLGWEFGSMAYDPADDILYAGVGNYISSSCNGCIYTVDPYSGDTALVIDGFYTNVPGMTVDPLSGIIYGLEYNTLFTLDPVGPAWTQVPGAVPLPYDQAGQDGLSFDGSGNLYAPVFQGLHEMDKSDGSYSWARQLIFSGFPVSTNPQLSALTVRPSDGQAFGAVSNSPYIDEPSYFAKVDLCALTVEYVANLPTGLNAIAFVANTNDTMLPPPCMTAAPRPGEVILNWRKYPAADMVKVYWATAPGIDPGNPATYNDVLVFDPATAAHTFTGLTDGTTYYYVATAAVGGKEITGAEITGRPNTDIVEYNFDAGLGTWTPSGGTPTWGVSTVYANTANNSVNQSPDVNPVINTEHYLTSQAYDFSAYTKLSVSYQQLLRFYSTYKGYVEVSSDGGGTWTTAHVVNNMGQYISETAFAPILVDLTPHIVNMANVAVRFRFYTTLTSGSYKGWFIDDVVIIPQP